MRSVHGLRLAVCGTALLAGGAARAQEVSGIETVVVTAEKRAENIQTIPITVQAFTSKQVTELGIKSSTDLSQFTPNLDIALVAGQGNQPIISIRGVGLNDYDTNNAGPNGVYADEVYLSSPASQTFQTFDLERIEILKGPQGTLYGRNTSGGAINFVSTKPTDDWTGSFHAEYGSFDTLQVEGGIGGPIADSLDFRVAAVKNNSGGFTRDSITGLRENGANNIAGRAMLRWKPASALTILANVHGGSVANRPNEYRHIGDLDPASVFSGGVLQPFAGVQCSVAMTNAGQCVDLFGYGTPKSFYGGAYDRTAHLKVHNWGGYLKADWVATGWTPQPITLTSLTAFEHNDKIHPEDSDASPNRLLEIDFGVRSATFTQEFRATQSVENYNWVAGLYYLSESLHQNQPLYLFQDADLFFDPAFGPDGGDGIAEIAQDHSRQVTDSYAAFGQGTWEFAPNLNLTIGARFTGESKSFQYEQSVQVQSGGINNYAPPVFTFPEPTHAFSDTLSSSAFNWRSALDYQMTDAVMAYASVATGFKSGGFNGSFLGNLPFPDPNQVIKQLQPIKPERVRTYEVGVKSDFFDDRLQIDAAAFYNDYRDLQVFILSPISAPPPTNFILVNILSNASKAHMEGLDLSLIAKPIENLTFTGQLGLLQAEIDSNEQIGVDSLGNPISDHAKQLPLSPHVTLSTMLDYRVPIDANALDFQLSANFKSHQFFDETNDLYTQQAPFWIENARVAYSFDDDEWEAGAFVRNLAGQKYLIDAFDLTAPFGLIQGIMGMPRTYGVELNYNF